MSLKWRRRPPHKPGYYWVSFNAGECIVAIVKVIETFTQLSVKKVGSDATFHPDEYDWWYGPLEPPGENS